MAKKSAPKSKATQKSTTATTETTAKAHKREPKKSEQELLKRGRELAAAYLTQRDGMDEDVARMVIEGMEPEQVNELINEANSAVIDRIQTPAPVPQQAASNLVPEEEAIPVDFLEVEELAGDADFPQLVLEAVEAARVKNSAEKEYKEKKKVVIGKMKAASVELVQCLNVRLAVYTGSTKTLSATKLLEKGVSIDVINKCYEVTEYDDVRMTVPKPKVGA